MTPSASIFSNTFTFGLIAAGSFVCVGIGGPLASDPDLKSPLNPFGINTSPYGEVLAMAMQGPIDVHFHNGASETQAAEKPQETSFSGKGKPRDSFRKFLDELESAHATRTNPKPASAAQSRHNRRQVENKLRFAYELDPSHYANYNAYHFFLTEPALGTRPELTPGAAKLAERTIEYCLKKTDDPRPALTAAAATENILELMFNDRMNPEPRFTPEQMRPYLPLLDQCIARYQELSDQWTANGNWARLSERRRMEAEERLYFILAIRKAIHGTFQRLDQGGNLSVNPDK